MRIDWMKIEKKTNDACRWLLQALGTIAVAILLIMALCYYTGIDPRKSVRLPRLNVERVAGRCGWGLDDHWMPAKVCEADSWHVWINR